MKKGILVVGSVNADIFIELNHLPAPGETLSASNNSGYVLPGGKGANQAVAVRRLLAQNDDLKVKFCCNFGSDTHADMLKTVLKSEDVDISLCKNVDGPTGQAFILLQSGGENSIILVGGANMTWPKKLPNELVTAIRGSSIVMLQREVPPYINIAVAKTAHEAGALVMQDLGGADTPLPEELIPYLFMLSPNETELSRITSLPTENFEQVKIAAKVLFNKGVKIVLVTLGSKGAILFNTNGDVIKINSVPPEKGVVDTTGAGDTFRAAFAVGLVEGRSFQEALEFAAHASTLCIGVKGAMPSLPKRQETLSFMNTRTKSKL